MTRKAIRIVDVLTFVIVILFRPICCHETAQSSPTHVPTTRPFVDLEQAGMIAEWFRRKVFGDCWWRKEIFSFRDPCYHQSYLFWSPWSTRCAPYLRPRQDKAWTLAVYCYHRLCNSVLNSRFETDSPGKNTWSDHAIHHSTHTLTFGADASPPSPCRIAGSTNFIPRTSIRPRSRRFCKANGVRKIISHDRMCGRGE